MRDTDAVRMWKLTVAEGETKRNVDIQDKRFRAVFLRNSPSCKKNKEKMNSTARKIFRCRITAALSVHSCSPKRTWMARRHRDTAEPGRAVVEPCNGMKNGAYEAEISGETRAERTMSLEEQSSQERCKSL